MAESLPLTQARARFGELVKRARFGRERFIVTEHGKPVAAIVSLEELSELEAAANAADEVLGERLRASSEPDFSHESVTALMAALDAAEAVGTEAGGALLAPHREILAAADSAEADGLVP